MYEVCIFQHNFYTVYLQWNTVWTEQQLRNSDSMACIVTILRAGKYEIQNLAGTKDFSFPKCPYWLWAHPVCYSMGNGNSFSWKHSSQDMRLTTHCQLAPRLRTSTNIPSLPLHAFITWPGTTLHLLLLTTADTLIFPEEPPCELHKQ